MIGLLYIPYLGCLQQTGAASPVSMMNWYPWIGCRAPSLQKTSQYSWMILVTSPLRSVERCCRSACFANSAAWWGLNLTTSSHAGRVALSFHNEIPCSQWMHSRPSKWSGPKYGSLYRFGRGRWYTLWGIFNSLVVAATVMGNAVGMLGLDEWLLE